MTNDEPRTRSARSLLAWSMPFVLSLLSTGVLAQDWSFAPRLAVGGEVDDNAQLTVRTDDVVELEGYLLQAAADITYLSQTTRFGFIPLVVDRNYPNDDIFDSTMYDARLNYLYRTPRHRLRLNAWFNQDDIRNAERADIDLDEDDPDNIPDDDTGLVQLKGNRDRISFRPGWAYDWSESSTTDLRIDYRDVSYDDQLLLNDYTDARFTAAYTLDFTPRTTGFVAATVRNYDLVNEEGEFDTKAINIGFDTQLSETLQMRVGIGAEDVESSVTGLNETRPVGEVAFRRRLETIRLLARYRRSLTASGRGRMSERDSVSIHLTRTLNERIAAGLGLLAYASNPIQLEPGDSTFGRNYAQLTARFTWNITRSFSMETMYRYTWVDREAVGESANSNHLILWFVYQPGRAPDEMAEVGF